MKRLPLSLALLASTALVAAVSLAPPAWAVGGLGGGGAAGGVDSVSGAGGAGSAGSGGGGGGGAGATGGDGGSASGGAGGSGGASAGADGSAGVTGGSMQNGSGGGGGAHGAVGSTLPGAAATGGDGGRGGDGGTLGAGGGGGAGGWGAVVTGFIGTATLSVAVTGGNGGDGGDPNGGGSPAGIGGSGGIGLYLGSGTTSLTINAAVTGGNGGATPLSGPGGAGGAGIVISTSNSVSLTLGAAVSGGYAGNGGPQAYALDTGTSGVHRVTIAAGGALNGGVQIGAGSSLTLVNSGDVTLSGTISGGGSLSKEGAGTLTLTAANTHAGGTTILAGAISVAADDALGQVNTGDGLRLAGNAQLITTASFTSNRNITLGNSTGGGFAPALGTVLTLTGTITQGGTPSTGLIVAGQGQVIYTGTGAPSRTQIQAGATLRLGDGGTSGSLGSGPITNNGMFIVNRSDAVTLSNAISGTGEFILSGGGTTTLNGALSYTGLTWVQTGVLALGHAGLFSAGTSSFEVASGATLNLASLSGVLSAGSIAGGGIITLPSSGQLSLAADSLFAGEITGGGGLLVAGGTTTLTGANSFTGGTTIQAGARLQLGQGGTTGAVPGNIVANGTLAFHRSDNVSLAAVISGTGNLVQMGPGALILTGANTYAGTTTISAGTLQLGDGGTQGMLGSGAVVNNATLLLARTDAYTLANNMTGTGELTLSSGTVTATGSLAHSGGTTIHSGARLNIGQGGTTGSLAGNVVNHGTLSFARSDSLTVPGAISGSGGVQQNGTGNLILAGANTYTGPTVVNAGTLSVNGSISGASAITLAPGATLGGSGQLGSLTLPSGATLAPGNSIGTITLAGLSLAAGSTTAIEVQGATADRINVTGTASLGGTLRLLPLGGSYQFNTPYTLLQAGSVTGNFATITTGAGFGAGVTPMVSVTATQVQLALAPAMLVPPPFDATTPPAPAVAPAAPGIPGFLTYNLRATAGALDAANRAGADLSRFFNVYNQPASTIGLAVNQLSGEVATSTGAMGFAAGDQFLATLLDPLGRAALLGGRLRPAGDGDDAGAPRKRHALWGSATGAHNRTTGESQDGTASRTTRSAGFVLGFDHLVGQRGVLGLAIAVGEGSAAVASGQGSATANFGQIGAHGSTRLGRFTLAGAGAVTLMDVDTKRTQYFLGHDQQRAGFNAQVYSLRAELRHDGMTAHGLRLQPVAAIQWQQVNNQGYTEASPMTGSATGLSVAGQSQVSLRGELGAQLDGAARIGVVPVQGFLRAAWAHGFIRDAAMGVGFASLPQAGFTVRGARPDANSALVSAGLEVPLRPGLTLVARLDGEFSGNVTQLAGTARLRYAF